MRRLLALAAVLAVAPAAGAPAAWVSAAWASAGTPAEYPLGAVGAFFDRLLHGFRHLAPRPGPQVHYVVGAPYSLGGIWHYPREQFAYDQTGIATVYGGGHSRLTADGEAFDPAAMAAAHRTLQLPAIARLTNLDNGRQVLVRINDRGLASPARLIAVTPAVAKLLGFGPAGTARVRVELDQAMSESLAQQLSGGLGGLKVAAAPLGAVQTAALPPPPGMAAAAPDGAPVLSDAPAATGADPLAPVVVPLRLPPALTQVPPEPDTLWVECDSFSRLAYAERERARLAGLGAGIRREGAGRTERDTVQIGPIATIAAADAMLQQALGSGVSGARIVVEQE